MEEPSDEPERYTRKKSRPAPKKISSAKSPINIVDLYDGQRNTALPEEEFYDPDREESYNFNKGYDNSKY